MTSAVHHDLDTGRRIRLERLDATREVDEVSGEALGPRIDVAASPNMLAEPDCDVDRATIAERIQRDRRPGRGRTRRVVERPDVMVDALLAAHWRHDSIQHRRSGGLDV